MNTTTVNLLTSDLQKEIDHWSAKFPDDKKRSALLMALRIVQKKYGWLSETLLDQVADYLNCPHIWAYEVASFYSMFDRAPVGKFKLSVCNSISCHLCDAKKVMKHLKEKLEIDSHGNSKDGLFTVKETECLGACAEAPMLLLGENKYLGNMNATKIDALIESLKKEAKDDR
jgi:NADH-quinone oxidoreductase subunit E